MEKDERKDLTLDWDSLTISEQSEYHSRALYLINNGYVMDTDFEELAKKICETKLSAEYAGGKKP